MTVSHALNIYIYCPHCKLSVSVRDRVRSLGVMVNDRVRVRERVKSLGLGSVIGGNITFRDKRSNCSVKNGHVPNGIEDYIV